MELLAWIDVETTGLHPWKGDQLLEVACLVTGPDMTIMDDGYHAVVQYDPDEVQSMMKRCDPYVEEMHRKTGLWDRLPQGEPFYQIDANLHAYLSGHTPVFESIRLAGNSVRLDLNFVEAQLPRTYDRLHYRMLDVSSVAYVAEQMLGIPVPEKQRQHSALDDIRESIEEMRFYRDRLTRLGSVPVGGSTPFVVGLTRLSVAAERRC